MKRREFMIADRKTMGLTVEQMAARCNTTARIIMMLENDASEVTHPEIAKDVAKAYKMTPKQAEMLLPKNYRPSSPEYDPDKYKREPVFEVFGIIPTDKTIPIHVARRYARKYTNETHER